MSAGPPAPWNEFARAPLVPAALGAAAGLAIDRTVSVPLEYSLIAAFAGLALYFARAVPLAIPVAFAGLAAAHHHADRNLYDADDLGHFASSREQVVHLRGLLLEVPTVHAMDRTELFGPARRVDRATTVLSAREASFEAGVWRPVSGRVKVSVDRTIPATEPDLFSNLSIGDDVELVGLLATPARPSNPGEKDYSSFLLDRRIRCELRIVKDAPAITRLSPGDLSWQSVLANLRGRFTAVLTESMPTNDVPLARALLLGDTAATSRNDWDAFARTGVVHVLAISGQHLVILAGAVWIVLRLFGVPRHLGAWFVLALIIVYAALTGGRPSAVRAAVMVGIVCGGIIARRSVHLANAFALAWIIVLALDPTDAVTAGSVLSFVSVFVLIWGLSRWLQPREPTPVEQLIDESRPAWLKLLRTILRWLFELYIVNAVLLLALAPLSITYQNVAPLAGFIIGPPVVLLTTIAMLSGFVQLIVGLISPSLAMPFAFVTGVTLSWCKSIVVYFDHWSYGSLYLPAPPTYWTIGYYGMLIPFVLLASRRWLIALMLWTIFGLLFIGPQKSDELRVTFLSVGHGGCTVIETPDSRVLLYDAGTMAGPDAVKRIIAPYLWSRGIRRVDEVFLSHADLDHYNGVPELLRRFRVGQVTLTPSFASKPAPEVAEVILALDKHSIPRRIAVAGDRFTAGDVAFDVLHPPADGPSGTENERSLVLKIAHREHVILLTGDLEKAGTSILLTTPSRTVDVMMAPHHGSTAAFPEALRNWANPKLIVVSRGQYFGGRLPSEAWDTWSRGAVILHSHTTGLTAETFRDHERRVIVHGR